jgi:hypothetical protein
MLRRNYSLILVAVWLVIGVCLIAPDILPESARKHLKTANGGLIGLLAFLFAIYNFARWWAMRNLYGIRAEAVRRVNPLSVRKIEKEPEPYEPNPDLNFIKLLEDETPKDDSAR